MEKIEIYLLSGKGENLRKKAIFKGQALSQGMGLLPKLNFLFLVYTSHRWWGPSGRELTDTGGSQEEDHPWAAFFPGFLRLVPIQRQERTLELRCPGLNPGPFSSQLSDLEHQPLPASAGLSGGGGRALPPSGVCVLRIT